MTSRKHSIRPYPTKQRETGLVDDGWTPTSQAEATAGSTLEDMQLEVALYVESISAELRMMAKDSKLDSLAYFLEMARIEASIQVERRATGMRVLPSSTPDGSTKY